MDDGLLERGGNGDLHHGPHHPEIITAIFFLFLIPLQLPHQKEKGEYRRDALGDQRCHRHSTDSLMEADHEHHIQRNV